jgi:D-tyrosyl-tRNA(Tyr) deacylase
MLALLQRVNYARIVVEGECIADMQKGILAFIAFERGDTPDKAKKMFDKILKYRIFSDDAGKMNLNVNEAGGNVMLISRITRALNTCSGNRPSFDPAMPPAEAKIMYDDFITYARSVKPDVESGEFAADMKISLENDGPVTFTLKM